MSRDWMAKPAHARASGKTAEPAPSSRVQFRRALAGMTYDQQVEALRPPPVQSLGSTPPVQMAAEGNQADTGIMAEANGMIQSGGATDVCDALDKLMRAAKQANDSQRIQKIKATQKAKGCRHSRHS